MFWNIFGSKYTFSISVPHRESMGEKILWLIVMGLFYLHSDLEKLVLKAENVQTTRADEWASKRETR